MASASVDTSSNLEHRLSVAPMMECTDRHFRRLLRCITRRTRLYTEMVTTGALLHGDRARFLQFDASQHPLALQLGGSDPADMALCAAIGQDWGYDEININVGCPSDRVQSGRFGACLLAEPDVVARCVESMAAAVSIPVTVKTRIGVDERDSYEHLHDFIRRVADAGCTVFAIHARKAWLKGLSPKENREIPPLRYDVVRRLKVDFPHLTFVLNGGVRSLDQALELLEPFERLRLDGVMIGRAAYEDPFQLAKADARVFGEPPRSITRHSVLDEYMDYVQEELARGTALRHAARHVMGLFHGVPGARAWRRHLSEQAGGPCAGVEVLEQAAAFIQEETQA